MRVVGTAGHVDHGKSTLVRALTGIDPDRLAEEKAREMTIDLGFAWFKLPNDETLGIVDVPGHRDFIENMLAGIGGIDAALLVIAADEGVMPQTREHLAILDLLGISKGLILLSKIELVNDQDWLELVEQDILAITAGTTLEGAPIVPISARSGAGLTDLVERLTALLADMPVRPDYHHPRLPIDRVFTISGFGTVVTGTLLGGNLRVGDEVEIQPGDLKGRIRGLQSYKQVVETAEPGSRVAVNLSGIEKKALERGFVLTYPHQLQSTLLADVRFRYLKDVERPLKHNAGVKCFVGAAEVMARVRLLSHELLAPGEEGWLQLALDKPLALAQGDRFILRYPSPSQTIGGGVVVNPQPARRWKRLQPDVLRELETRMGGTPAQRITQAADGSEPTERRALQKMVGYGNEALDTAIHEAVEQGLLLELPDGFFMSSAAYQRIVQFMSAELSAYHAAQPFRLGMAREELRSRTGLKGAAFNVLLNAQTAIVARNESVYLAGHEIRFDDEQKQKIGQLMEAMQQSPYTPPSCAEAVQLVGEVILRALIDLGEIVQVQPDVIFTAPVYQELVSAVLDMIEENGSLAANELRDRFSTTRKYAIGLLEHLDSIGVTRRSGDVRVRGTRRI
jgi:selenocysteine-specific elongation factor